MDKKISLRRWVQICFTAISNGYVSGFAKGKIYQGDLKQFCLPGLNCYSCPGALGSCPIGSLQAVLSSRDYKFSFYILGFFLLIGALAGRFVCGFLCPFGLVQDLINKIPFPKKLKRLPGEKGLRMIKFVLLVGFVIILPLTVLDIVGQGKPWFCEFVCPSGTLFAGIPLVASNPPLQAALGFLFTWKMAILVVLMLLSVIIYRPFCRYLCPLGAVYGCFNSVAFVRYQVDKTKCTTCGICHKACPMDIKTYEKPNSIECVRCGACKKACPHGAINNTFLDRKKD